MPASAHNGNCRNNPAMGCDGHGSSVLLSAQPSSTPQIYFLALAGQMMGRLGGLAQLVSDQAVSSTYQAREAAIISYAAVSNRANKQRDSPNRQLLARINLLRLGRSDPISSAGHHRPLV
jgi:hypothetical protein